MLEHTRLRNHRTCHLGVTFADCAPWLLLRLIYTDQCVQIARGDWLSLFCAGKDIEKQCSGIYPLQSVYVRKVKILRAPRFDVSKLMEVHGDYTEEVCVIWPQACLSSVTIAYGQGQWFI